ncbi:MAG: S41 family peptidase [Elusimicrobiales bacterium]
MKKLLLLLLSAAAACSGKLPEDQVQKIFARHSFKEHAPQKIAAALKEGGAAGLAALDRRAAVLGDKLPLKARPGDKNISSGLLLGERGGRLVLLAVFPGSPAWEAGFREGDAVLAINGAEPSAEAARGALSKDTRFTLKTRRLGLAGPLEAEVQRGAFFFPKVFSFCDRENRAAFLRLGLFYEGSAEAAMAAVKAAEACGAEQLVVDLRDNPGGVPAEAAGVLKAFAAGPGPLLELRSRHAEYAALYGAEARGRYAGLKLAVLMNARTSMAAEIFALTLREKAGAALVGGRTAGSVSLTRAFSLGDGRGLRLTVSRLLPPSGADLEGAGAAPDAEAGEAGGLVWDNSREVTLLGDPAWLTAQELLRPGRARR